MSDFQKFLFEGLPVRGLIVRLTDSWEVLQSRREPALPDPVMALLGELSACALLLQSTIKFDGALILQVQGDGPVQLAVAEARNGLHYRATVKMANGASAASVPAGANLADLLNRGGKGRCAITLDPTDRKPGQQPYQGVVSLNDAQGQGLTRLSEAIEQYMRLSEQLDTKVVLAADARVAAGLLIQRLPLEGQGNLGAAHSEAERLELEDAFPRIAMKAATLTREELLRLPIDDVLHRLFWEEDLRRFDPGVPVFSCVCSRQRVGRMLVQLGRDDIESLLAEQGQAEVGCDFCGAQYRFDAVDVAQLFAAPSAQPPTDPALQ